LRIHVRTHMACGICDVTDQLVVVIAATPTGKHSLCPVALM